MIHIVVINHTTQFVIDEKFAAILEEREVIECFSNTNVNGEVIKHYRLI